MRRLAFALVLAAGSRTALADAPSAFDALAASAVKIPDGRALAGLFWAATTTCAPGDDLLKRQCEGVRASRGAANAGRTFVMRGDAGALAAGAWDKGKSALGLSVRGCLACGEALEIGGEQRYVVTRGGKLGVAGGALLGPELKLVPRPFATEDAAKKWAETTLARLRVEVLFKVPAKPVAWSQGGARGYAVELVGYRVVDPCDGSIVASEPASAAVPADSGACIGEKPVAVEPPAPNEPPPPAEPQLPERLAPGVISASMTKARADVDVCFTRYGIRGNAYLTIEIGGDGKVKDVKLRGDFEDSPTGDCIVGAVRGTEFPKFRQPSMTIKDFPFILR